MVRMLYLPRPSSAHTCALDPGRTLYVAAAPDLAGRSPCRPAGLPNRAENVKKPRRRGESASSMVTIGIVVDINVNEIWIKHKESILYLSLRS